MRIITISIIVSSLALSQVALPAGGQPVETTIAPSTDLSSRLALAHRLDAAGLRNLKDLLAASSWNSESKAYHEAHLRLRLSEVLKRTDRIEAEAEVDQAIQSLESRSDGESLALLGACYIQKMGLSWSSRMTLGSRSGKIFTLAQKQAPNNPRVLGLYGKYLLGMPAFYGGGPSKAIPVLEEANRLIQSESTPTAPSAPQWGRIEIPGWLALAKARLAKQ